MKSNRELSQSIECLADLWEVNFYSGQTKSGFLPLLKQKNACRSSELQCQM